MRFTLSLVLAFALCGGVAQCQQLPSFFIALRTASSPATHRLQLDVFDTRCERTLEPAIVLAQLYDVINTAAQLRRYPASRENDWWTVRFAGPSGRNLAGIAFGIALNDYLKWRLTARSRPLRCVVEMNQLYTTIESIGETHPL